MFFWFVLKVIDFVPPAPPVPTIEIQTNRNINHSILPKHKEILYKHIAYMAILVNRSTYASNVFITGYKAD